MLCGYRHSRLKRPWTYEDLASRATSREYINHSMPIIAWIGNSSDYQELTHLLHCIDRLTTRFWLRDGLTSVVNVALS